MNKIVLRTLVLLFLLGSKVCAEEVTQNWTSYAQQVDIKKYSELDFRVSARIKSTNSKKKTNAALWARIDGAFNERLFFENNVGKIETNADWQRFEINGTVAKRSSVLYFGAFSRNGGTHFYDDFKVEIKGKTGKWEAIAVSNPGFEQQENKDKWFQGIRLDKKVSNTNSTINYAESASQTGEYSLEIKFKERLAKAESADSFKYIADKSNDENFTSTDKPRNIVLIIADGFGFGHLSLAQVVSTQENKNLWKSFDSYGYLQPYDLSGLITDSGASATAIAVGEDVEHGEIGKIKNGSKLQSVLEKAKEKGYSTGFVTDSYIWDATLAPFYAYSTRRTNKLEMLKQLATSELDIVAGELNGASGKLVIDWHDTVKLMSKKYDVYERELPQQDVTKPTIALFSEKSIIDMDSSVNLVEITDFALSSFLKKEKPFFLIIESEEPDSASHAKDVKRMGKSIETLNALLKKVYNMTKVSNDTLVIFVSDHESGGLVLNVKESNKKVLPVYTSWSHTGSLVPVFAKGPGHEIAAGNISNEQLGQRLLALIKHREAESR